MNDVQSGKEMVGMGTVESASSKGLAGRLVARFEGDLAARVGAALLFVGAISTYWDIATHIDVGRERFLTPAHIGIYSSVLVSAICIALSGLADHFRAGESFLGALRHPFRNLRPGIGVAGAGMVTTLVAAPFDNAWHEIYGIDVTIWSPPHLLAIFGIAAATLGLAALVAPAVARRDTFTYPALLAGFLTGLLVTTGEFEFNAPQYRIAYHPIILGASCALVFTTAAGRWRAATTGLWFQGVRLASVLFLLAVDRSLTFVPIVLPAAIVADVMTRNGVRRGAVTGAAVAGVTVITNWIALELLPGLQWPGDDFLLGAPLAVVLGALAGILGGYLGTRLDGVGTTVGSLSSLRRAAAALLLPAVLVLSASPALAHEVGGSRGGGTISWLPGVPEAGETIEVEISNLSLHSGSEPQNLRIEAWRAEHRITVPVRGGAEAGSAELTLPEEGLWFLFVRAEADDESLLWGDHFTVAEAGAGSSGAHRQRFTLGVDTLAQEEPAAWVDVIAYGVSLVMLGLLITGVTRALRRLPHPHADVGMT